MKIIDFDSDITEEILEEIRAVAYPEESFDKFSNPNNPDYEIYKGRQIEEAMDRGNNNVVEAICRILEIEL